MSNTLQKPTYYDSAVRRSIEADPEVKQLTSLLKELRAKDASESYGIAMDLVATIEGLKARCEEILEYTAKHVELNGGGTGQGDFTR